jgi:hypothetical protein
MANLIQNVLIQNNFNNENKPTDIESINKFLKFHVLARIGYGDLVPLSIAAEYMANHLKNTEYGKMAESLNPDRYPYNWYKHAIIFEKISIFGKHPYSINLVEIPSNELEDAEFEPLFEKQLDKNIFKAGIDYLFKRSENTPSHEDVQVRARDIIKMVRRKSRETC